VNRVELRPARAADALAIAEVLLASRKTFLPYAPIPHTDAEVRAWVAAELLPSHAVTVATEGDEIVGVVAFAERDGIAWLSQLYLCKEYVGQGIGSRLLAHAVASTSLPVRLYAFQSNDGARRFYERHGFAAIEFSDGSGNEERCPDVLYELRRC
jgi:GNAT superfamily N-acetyltransferase